MAEYLEYGYVTDDRCIYQGLSKVPAATILEWDGGRISMRSYWQPPTQTDFRGSFDDAVQETRRLFLQAVERRLQADVAVGALLSGGIDSSSGLLGNSGARRRHHCVYRGCAWRPVGRIRGCSINRQGIGPPA